MLSVPLYLWAVRKKSMTKVLIADDLAVTRKLLQGILEKHGYQVVAAQDGLQAWEVLNSERDIRLAIFDWMMPGMDGVDICRKLREKRKSDPVYTILLTSKTSIKDVTAGLEAGANDYVTKPFAREELLARLAVGERVITLQTQLTQSQKLDSIGQLAAGIAHEINTPTQYVRDNTQFVKEAVNDIGRLLDKYGQVIEAGRDIPAISSLVAEVDALIEELDMPYLASEIPKAIDQSLDGIDRMARVVGAMSEFARPGVEGKTNVDINRAIENTIAVSRSRWQSVAELRPHLDDELPPVFCMGAEVNQVILELIINAADAISAAISDSAKDRGFIDVSTRIDHDCVEVRVSDSGPGIPQAVQDKVFNPFFTTKDVGQGTGQGLAMCHSIIVDKHGGSLTFETEMGAGTTFIVRLPMDAASSHC